MIRFLLECRRLFEKYSKDEMSVYAAQASFFIILASIPFLMLLLSLIQATPLDGYICKEPIYRKTPLGREIADLLVAVNRPYGKSDYIPCIAWGWNARFASGFSVGTRIQIWGRVQSREYTKKLSETECEKRTAYEVSVSKLECCQ